MEFSLLRRIDVALKIDAYRRGRPALAGFAAPDTVVVLRQFSNVGEAGFLNFRLGLSFGEAVATGDGSVGVVLSGTVNRVVVRSRLRGRVLCGSCCSDQQSDRREKKRAFHGVLQSSGALLTSRIAVRSEVGYARSDYYWQVWTVRGIEDERRKRIKARYLRT